MASPLSPTPSYTLNATIASTPLTSRRYDKYDVQVETVETYTAHSDHGSIDSANDGDTSSPFMSQVRDDQENNPPPRLRPASRVLSGAELSPLKLLQERPKQQRPSLGSGDEAAPSSLPPPVANPRSPRKMSAPEKRFPVRISTAFVSPTEETPRLDRSPAAEQAPQLSLDTIVRDNEGLKHAIDIFEDTGSILDDTADPDATALGADDHDGLARVDSNEELQQQQQQQRHGYDDSEPAAIDDTMVSTFSTFSAVPNLTMFANLRPDGTASPSKFAAQPSPMRTPRAANGPLPNRTAQYESGNTTSLMDFTENLRLGAYQPPPPTSPSRREHGGRSTSPSRPPVPATPQRNGLSTTTTTNPSYNLLDFDIPPLPTPRSIPTITPRELESLKSGFLSEISSLKASLSGKEAEAASLKTAVGDAEKRVGECMERLRGAEGAAAELAAEREGWERRGREMEAVLRQVRAEMVRGRREREELEARLDESEKRRDAAETMAQEAESKMAGMRAGKASAEAAAANGGKVASPRAGDAGSNREVEIAVERVARELHALYKSKHETKVAALKKSYESRWEKRVRELEGRIDELGRENEELRLGRDNATLTLTTRAEDASALERLREEMEAERKAGRERRAQLEAEAERLEAVVRAVQADNGELRGLLERERVEKGELVQLAEEMMNMQSFVGEAAREQQQQQQKQQQPVVRGTPATAKKVIATPSKVGVAGRVVPPSPSPGEAGYRGSFGGVASARVSGLRAPAAGGASRIGKVGGAHGRTMSSVSSSSGVPRPGSGMGMRSGLLSSIEKMGSYRGGRAE